MKKDFSKYLLEAVVWNKVITFVNNIPKEFNERERRFEKAKMIQDCIEMFSNGKLKFIGEVGFDFIITDKKSKFNNLKVELKSGKNMFTIKDKHDLKRPTSKTTKVILNNSNGSSLKKVYTKTYDFLLLVDIAGFAVATWEEVFPHAKNDGAGFGATIPLQSLSIQKIVDEKVHKVNQPITDHFTIASHNMIKDIIKYARPI